MTVGLVIVSHSSKIADGIVELAGQMAEGVRIVAAGGTDEGGIGTSFQRVSDAITASDDGGGVVVLCDLGSAILTAETALDFLDEDLRGRIVIVDAPVVEGAVAAAVAAQTGGDLEAVTVAARTAWEHDEPEEPELSAPTAVGEPSVTRTATLRNKDGLHARPAAEFVKLASTFEARVTVNGVDAKSMLRIMSLGARSGSEVTLTAEGPDAQAAVDALAELIDSSFGE